MEISPKFNHRQPNNTTKIVQAIAVFALTGIFSVGGSFTVSANTIANPVINISNRLRPPSVPVNNLPKTVKNAVLRDAARRSKIPRRQLEIVSATEHTWRNGCLELARPGELCTQALVPGWRVVVSDRQKSQTWVYHTNHNGRNLRFASGSVQPPISDNLPRRVRDAVFKAASQRLKVPTSRLNLIQVQQRTWRNGCLEIIDPNRLCTQVMVEGWRVVVGMQEQTLVYHTDDTGNVVVLNQNDSTIIGENPQVNLPRRIQEQIISYLVRTTGFPAHQLRISDAQEITVDGCLSLPAPQERCTRIALPAYRVTVVRQNLQAVVHILQDGRQIRLDRQASTIPLP